MMPHNPTQKVLIIDEEEGGRESLKMILGDHYDLILTDSGIQGLECLDKDRTIGLVLLNMKIPKVNGLEVLKAIQEKHPALNVIIISGYKAIETAAETPPMGTRACITKPFKSDEILNVVRKNLK